MNEDRLEEIKIGLETYIDHEDAFEHLRWLISEDERLRIVADQLMFALGRHEATIATLREALEEGVRLYETNGLLANDQACGAWVNSSRKALATVQEE